jgi:hypothetical protein
MNEVNHSTEVNPRQNQRTKFWMLGWRKSNKYPTVRTDIEVGPPHRRMSCSHPSFSTRTTSNCQRISQVLLQFLSLTVFEVDTNSESIEPTIY